MTTMRRTERPVGRWSGPQRDDEDLQGFFAELAEDVEVPDVLDEEPDPPPWVAPPEDEVGGLLSVRRMVARSDNAAVVLDRVDVHPVGCAFVLRLSVRRPPGLDAAQWWDIHNRLFGSRPFGSDGTGGDGPHFGVRYADGGRLLASDAYTLGDPGSPPPGPVLAMIEDGARGGGRRVTMDRRLWLWPLPPPELLELIVAWPAFGIDVTRVALDGAELVAVASHSEDLWPTS
jgi:hypothetical protein